jgi:hypothetical protein
MGCRQDAAGTLSQAHTYTRGGAPQRCEKRTMPVFLVVEENCPIFYRHDTTMTRVSKGVNNELSYPKNSHTARVLVQKHPRSVLALLIVVALGPASTTSATRSNDGAYHMRVCNLGTDAPAGSRVFIAVPPQAVA